VYLHYFLAGAPLITIAPESQKVAEDMIVSFFCQASGFPEPAVSWERAEVGQRIIPISRHFGNGHTVVPMSNGSVLRIEAVKADRDDSVDFICVADNGIGEPASGVASLTVYGNPDRLPRGYPRITLNPTQKQTVVLGRSVVLKCEATADRLAFRIIWLRTWCL
jgi:hypothetical protein